MRARRLIGCGDGIEFLESVKNVKDEEGKEDMRLNVKRIAYNCVEMTLDNSKTSTKEGFGAIFTYVRTRKMG